MLKFRNFLESPANGRKFYKKNYKRFWDIEKEFRKIQISCGYEHKNPKDSMNLSQLQWFPMEINQFAIQKSILHDKIVTHMNREPSQTTKNYENST